MALAPGMKLGPYEIVDLLGAGGMGEVYRARDTRLDRTVAVKVLSSALVASPELKQRFEREARSLSSISHPHICALYDVGNQDGTEFLVMEYVQGDTLDRRLARGPIPPDELLHIAIQLADALDKAHRQGLVHRDIKPGNVMLTKSGAKLMDFGLAKASKSAVAGQSVLSAVATMSSPARGSQPLTGEGTIVGTFHYMSPEQIQGQEADPRSDIFSFGALLYEMATARRAFAGKTQASVIASILAIEPPLVRTLQPGVPPALERLIRTCLEKDPAERVQSAHDLKLQLQSIAEAGPSAGVSSAWVNSKRTWLISGAALLLAVLVGFGSAAWLAPRPERAPPLRAIMTLPKDVVASPWHFALSPDGTKLVFMARKQGVQMLWLRAMDSLTAQPLTGTEDGAYPFWSPDSRSIGFFSSGKLKKIDAGGGPVVALADVDGRGGSWNRDGMIVFCGALTGLKMVAASGGTVREITKLSQGEESTQRWPEFLPDDRHVLYFSDRKPSGVPGSVVSVGSLYLLDVKTGKTEFLALSESNAQYVSSGHLLYVVQGNLLAHPFDGSKFTGDPVPIAEQVGAEVNRWKGSFSASENGILTYMAGGSTVSQLIWFNRDGAPIKALLKPSVYTYLNLSPEGDRAAYSFGPPDRSNVWVDDLARDVPSPLTSADAQDQGAVWSRDGKTVTFARMGKGIFSRSASGVGAETAMLPANYAVFPNDWTIDGRSLLYMNLNGANASPKLWIHPTNGEKDYPLLQSGFTEANGHFSPDGKLLAYTGFDSGGGELYVVPYPSLSAKWKISDGGGYQPRWSPAGNEIFYISDDGKLMSAKYSAKGDGFKVDSVSAMFQTKIVEVQFTLNQYDVSPDGKRFLINSRPEETSQPFTVVTNWQSTIKR